MMNQCCKDELFSADACTADEVLATQQCCHEKQ
jgi:hypothetical protein